MGLGVPCLQREADAPDAGHLNDGYETYETINHSLAACRIRDNHGGMSHAFTPIVGHAKSDRLLAVKITIVTPAAAGTRHGNRHTASRWARLLRELGHRVEIQVAWNGAAADVLIA